LYLLQVPKQRNISEPLGWSNPQFIRCCDNCYHDTRCHGDSASIADELPTVVAPVVAICVTIDIVDVSPRRLQRQCLFWQRRLCSAP